MVKEINRSCLVSQLSNKFSSSTAFLDLGPGIAKANRPSEHQRVAGLAVNAVITKALKLILGPRLCVSHTRVYFAIVQYLQRVRIQILGNIVSFFNLVRIFLNKKVVLQTRPRR